MITKNLKIVAFLLVGLLFSSCNPEDHFNNDNNNPEENNYVVGSILCTDGSVVSVNQWPESGKTAQGVVFYIDGTGIHGWAVGLKDLGDYAWSTNNVNVGTLSDYSSADDASTDMDGYGNTQKIRNAGTSSKFPAAYCVNFSNGWYMPACGQLYELVNNITTVNSSLSTLSESGVSVRTLNTTSACWWSSTEFGSSKAWFVKYNGLRYNGLKSVDLTVRAVCDF